MEDPTHATKHHQQRCAVLRAESVGPEGADRLTVRLRAETEWAARKTRCDDERVPTYSPSVRDQAWRAVDPTGENRALTNAAVHGGRDVPEFLRCIGLDADEAWGHLAVIGVKFRRFVEEFASAVGVLGPRGWAVTAMDAEVVPRAVQAVEAGRGAEADDLLAGQWEGG